MTHKLTILITTLFITLFANAQNPTVWRNGTDGIYPDKGLLRSWPATGPEIIWTF